MSYNTSELLSLPTKDKISLAEALWSSVEEEVQPTAEEIEFAEERLQLHNATLNDGLSVEAFKNYFKDKYGF
ncbi:MAG: addiction module protein [Pedobacter sp.]|nr:addiction module protein [Chitinophagaceae bacterium]